jgi:hypothetical protein
MQHLKERRYDSATIAAVAHASSEQSLFTAKTILSIAKLSSKLVIPVPPVPLMGSVSGVSVSGKNSGARPKKQVGFNDIDINIAPRQSKEGISMSDQSARQAVYESAKQEMDCSLAVITCQEKLMLMFPGCVDNPRMRVDTVSGLIRTSIVRIQHYGDSLCLVEDLTGVGVGVGVGAGVDGVMLRDNLVNVFGMALAMLSMQLDSLLGRREEAKETPEGERVGPEDRKQYEHLMELVVSLWASVIECQALLWLRLEAHEALSSVGDEEGLHEADQRGHGLGLSIGLEERLRSTLLFQCTQSAVREASEGSVHKRMLPCTAAMPVDPAENYDGGISLKDEVISASGIARMTLAVRGEGVDEVMVVVVGEVDAAVEKRNHRAVHLVLICMDLVA